MPLDEDTLARLLAREHNKLAAYAWSLVHDDHLVDDILQEMSIVAIRKRQEINDEQHLLAWLRITCRRTALDLLRRRNSRPHPLGEAALDLLDLEWSKRETTHTADVMEALRFCLDQLKPYARQLMELRHRDGMSSAGIAQLLGRNLASVHVAVSRVHRALGNCIRQRLAKEAACE